MSTRRVRPAEDDPDEVPVEIVYTNDMKRGDEAFSFARSVRGPDGPDTFNKDVKELRQLKGLSSASKARLSRQINKYHRGDDSKTKSVTEEQLTGYGQFELVPPPYNQDLLAKLYESNAVHFAAVTAKVTNVVELGHEWRETRRTQEKLQAKTDEDSLERARKKVDRHKEDMDRLLESWNEEDLFSETLAKVLTDRESTGNGYMEIGRKANGQVGYVGHIPSTTMRVRKERDGFVQIVNNKVTFFRNFGDRKTPDPIGGDKNPNEIIHFKKYTPKNSYYGIPDVISAMGAIAGMEFAQRFNLDYFEHKAVPRYIILVKGGKLPPDAEQKLIDFFSTQLKGQHHRSVYIPLPKQHGGADIEFEIVPIEAKVQDASFQKYHDMNRDTILMAHRVPKTKVGLSVDVSLAVARDADKFFKEQVTRPVQRRVEKKLAPLFAEFTDVLEFKLNELTLTDEETISKIHERQLRWKIKNPNEVREELGMKGYEGGDEFIDAFAQRGKEERSQAREGRQREQEAGSGPDSESSANGRNAKGEGSSDE